MENNMMDIDRLNFAFDYAKKKHEKQLRKGTTVPYVVHLYEVMQYLKEEGATEDGVIAGVLHDVVEDTGTSLGEIRDIFGENIAYLVGMETEEKGLPYLERKRRHMNRLKNGTDLAKLVNCADKLSNLRSIYLDLKTLGDKTWDKFNSTKDNIKAYYTIALDALSSIKEHEIYKKFKYYYDLVF